jgi:hypothetical protein
MSGKHDSELTAAKLAERLGCNVETVWRQVRHGMPHRRKRQRGRKSVLIFDWAAVEPWIDLRNVRGKTAPPETLAVTRQEIPLLIPVTRTERIQSAEVEAFLAFYSAFQSGQPYSRKCRLWLMWVRALTDDEADALRSGRKNDKIFREIAGEVGHYMDEWRGRVKEFLGDMPEALAATANPGNPGTAKAALIVWRDKTAFPLLDSKIPNVETNNDKENK